MCSDSVENGEVSTVPLNINPTNTYSVFTVMYCLNRLIQSNSFIALFPLGVQLPVLAL